MRMSSARARGLTFKERMYLAQGERRKATMVMLKGQPWVMLKGQPCNGVVGHCSSVECRVGSQDPSGAPPKSKESTKKVYLNLVETLPNVGGTTSDLFA